MLIFYCKSGNRSNYWNLIEKECYWSEYWNLRTTLRIDQNVEIWVQNVKSIKMLKFEWKMSSRSICWNLSEKGSLIKMSNLSERRTKLEINQNVEIWVLITKSFKMLYFEWKVGNQSKSWHLSAIRWELIKMLKFEPKRGNRSNVDILLQKWTSIKLLEFDWKIRNWSEYWNLRTTLRIDQNVEIWVQNVNSIWGKQQSITMLKFEWVGIDGNVLNWGKKGDWSNLLIFHCKSGNRSKCWNLVEK